MSYSFTLLAATENSGLAALGVDGQAFAIQLITFVLAYFVLRRFAFGPILKALQRRRETIDQGVQLGEDMKKQHAQLQVSIEKALQKSRHDGDKIIAEAQAAGRQAVRDAEALANKKSVAILKDAEQRIVKDTAKARHALEKELVGLVAEATEAVLEEKVDSKKDTELIHKFLKERG